MHPSTDHLSDDFSNPQNSSVPREQAPEVPVLTEHAESIRKLSRRVLADVIEIGRRLSECKRLVGHGNWLPWIRREFRWSERTARNFISAHEFSQSKSAKVADLAIDISSIYLLAAPSTPEAACNEVLHRLGTGEPLTHADVKGIVSEVRGRKTYEGTAKRRITMRDVKEYYGDFCKLSEVARAKILEERPENMDLAIHDALIRQRWKPPYRELQDFLDACETMAKRSVREILAAIPAEQVSATMVRVESAKAFLTDIDAKLQRDANANTTGTRAGEKRV